MKNIIILIALFIMQISISQDIIVNGSGLDGTFSNITDAVEFASPGDRILIAPQDLPYSEDTLIINKNLTIIPISTNSYIDIESSTVIRIVLDDISKLTLIGIRGQNDPVVEGVVNDLDNNIYSIINIIDSKFDIIKLDLPKTSLYLSYSDINRLAFAHGDLIGNRLKDQVLFGLFDYENISNQGYNFSSLWEFWPSTSYYSADGINDNYDARNQLNNQFISECQLLENALPFEESQLYSDTCRFIANKFGVQYGVPSYKEPGLILFSLDFPFDIRNNFLSYSPDIYLLTDSEKGTNHFINNSWGYSDVKSFTWMLAYCEESGLNNFSDFSFKILNNKGYGSSNAYYNSPKFRIDAPYSWNNDSPLENLSINSDGVVSYNDIAFYAGSGEDSFIDFSLFFQSGPIATGNDPNPSLEYLDLDLTNNTPGIEGGSHAWENYHGYNYTSPNDFVGDMPSGSKARITYLNLPTQIYDSSIIQNIKAKSIHGN